MYTIKTEYDRMVKRFEAMTKPELQKTIDGLLSGLNPFSTIFNSEEHFDRPVDVIIQICKNEWADERILLYVHFDFWFKVLIVYRNGEYEEEKEFKTI